MTKLYKRIRKAICMLSLSALFVLGSCSNNDYLNVIPGNCQALMAIDMIQSADFDGQTILKSLLHTDDAKSCGIDFTSKAYAFETKDGNLGICVKLNDADAFDQLIDRMVSDGKCSKKKIRSDISFALVGDSWLAGYSDYALMVLGPITISARNETEKTMVKYFKQDEDRSILASKFYAHIDSLKAPITLAAQVSALPEKFAAPFMIGIPRDADPSKVLISANVNIADGVLKIDAKASSENTSLNDALEKAYASLRPITNKFLPTFDKDAAFGMFLNVDGTDFLPMLQQNEEFQALLAGVNTAIDIDNIIRSIDGDLCISVANVNEKGVPVALMAKLRDSKWLADVDYWKKSCKAGSHIIDAGTNAFVYSDGANSFAFGVAPGMTFYSGKDIKSAEKNITNADNPLPENIRQEIEGKRQAMLINTDAMLNGSSAAGKNGILKSLIGDIHYILYYMK